MLIRNSGSATIQASENHAVGVAPASASTMIGISAVAASHASEATKSADT